MNYDLVQDLITGLGIPRSIPVSSFSHRDTGDLARLLANFDHPALGIAIRLSATGHVNLLSLASPDHIYLLTIVPPGPNVASAYKCLGDILDSSYGTLAGFDMAKLAIHIYNDLERHTSGVDLSTLFAPSARKPWEPSDFLAKRLASDINSRKIDKIWDDDDEVRPGDHVCLRAWVSAKAAQASISPLYGALKVNTRRLDSVELACLGRLLVQMYILDKAKPTVVENDFSHVDLNMQGELVLHNTRYSNHVRRSGKASHVVMTDTNGKEIIGRATTTKGKATTIRANSATASGAFKRVRVVGREDLTSSERARNEFILLVLRGKRTLAQSPFIRYLWFPSDELLRRSPFKSMPYRSIQDLNESQCKVVMAMVSKETDLIITHGPPGTGKTTTISAAVEVWEERCEPVWITAQSNVAVKNIAESLVKRGVEFRLIVSKEFYVEWHEHIYDKIQASIVRSDELPTDPVALERVILDFNVILCTLSTLSNSQLDIVFNHISVERLVIDEASQIDAFEYMHLLDKFQDLQKVCFFGDPKQLPPYGQENFPGLQSIFNMKQLRNPGFTYFLSTQYRMPIPLGDFISQEVYNNKIRSEHEISAMSSVRFVDVTKGAEIKDGCSWKNLGEVQTIVHLVRHYYQKMDFCVITPYDAQRAAIEKQLKQEELPWERVFNVDSFQGNESQYVLLSVARTKRPGFLQSQNRANVMLTRCKSGMVIVSNRAFLRTAAQNTLLGKLARYWEAHHGQTQTWVDWKLVAEKKADMPGVPLLPPAPVVTMTRPVLPIPNVILAGHYVPPRHNRIDEEPLEDIFPNLNIASPSKPSIRSRWDNSHGLAAVKHVPGAPSSFGHNSDNWRVGASSTSHVVRPSSQDPFPSLTSGNLMNLRGQWNHWGRSH